MVARVSAREAERKEDVEAFKTAVRKALSGNRFIVEEVKRVQAKLPDLLNSPERVEYAFYEAVKKLSATTGKPGGDGISNAYLVLTVAALSSQSRLEPRQLGCGLDILLKGIQKQTSEKYDERRLVIGAMVAAGEIVAGCYRKVPNKSNNVIRAITLHGLKSKERPLRIAGMAALKDVISSSAVAAQAKVPPFLACLEIFSLSSAKVSRSNEVDIGEDKSEKFGAKDILNIVINAPACSSLREMLLGQFVKTNSRPPRQVLQVCQRMAQAPEPGAGFSTVQLEAQAVLVGWQQVGTAGGQRTSPAVEASQSIA